VRRGRRVKRITRGEEGEEVRIRRAARWEEEREKKGGAHVIDGILIKDQKQLDGPLGKLPQPLEGGRWPVL
jgi:hypothetical protein